MARRSTKPKLTKKLEQNLCEASHKLSGNQEPSEFKHIVLGLFFLKCISDRFEERRATLEMELVAEAIKPERLPDFLEDQPYQSRDFPCPDRCCRRAGAPGGVAESDR